MTFGEDWGWGSARDVARKIYDAFRAAGGNFVDTANVYTNGSSELFLGDFIKGHRQSIVLATSTRTPPPGGPQIEYSLAERTVERELLPMAQAMGLGVTAWWPLASGVLTGKYHGGGASGASGASAPADARMDNEGMRQHMPEAQRAERIVAAVKIVAGQLGRSMAQVTLAWLRHCPVPVIPILGARRLAQLQDNLASFELTLNADQLKVLDAASRIELGFPYDLYSREMVRGFIYGGMRDRIVV